MYIIKGKRLEGWSFERWKIIDKGVWPAVKIFKYSNMLGFTSKGEKMKNIYLSR